jgi:progesterone-induced-blocking factor 1
LENKHQAQLRELREKHARGDVPAFAEKLDQYKKEFTRQSLVISEEAYIDLQS